MLRIPRPLLFLPLVWLACPAAPSSSPTPDAGDAARGEALYAAQCASCHGPSAIGGIAPGLLPVSDASAVTQRIASTMPPDEPGRCDERCAADITAWLASLSHDTVQPTTCEAFPPAKRQLRLLNRREYANTVRDLFSGGTCTSDAQCQLTSESCVSAHCAPDACGVTTFLWPANGKRPTSVHVAGSFNNWAPTVAAGGWAMTYVAAVDAYVVKRALENGAYQYKFVVDGQWLADPGNPNGTPDGFGGQNSLVTVQCTGDTAPASNVTARFPLETRPTGYAFDNNAEAGLVTAEHVQAYLDAAEALAQRAPSVSPCRPGDDPQPCATQFVRVFGRRAFRRPLSEEEVTRYAAFVLAQSDFATGLTRATEALLSSPYFLCRSELGAPQPDGTWRLTPFEVASALSYSLWATTPDDALLDAAAQGKLATAADVQREARRLLADPRAREVVRTFALQWLGVERVFTVDKAPAQFPTFTPALRQAMAEETQSLVEHVVFDGTGRFDELLTADYGYLDGTLAAHYGLSGGGAGLEKRALPPERVGLLGQGAVLASYAHSDQTSPVKRGVFVRQRLLCQDFPAPPANAGTVPKVDPSATTRERFRQHSSDPSCRGCHQHIDEVGFGFEGFDSAGAWRTTENGKTVDTSGDLTDVEAFGTGTHAPFTTLRGLAQGLTQSRRAKACFATTVARYVGGRVESDAQKCTTQALADAFVASGGDVKELLVNALSDERFLTRSSEVSP